jgi:hypothetical protein
MDVNLTSMSELRKSGNGDLVLAPLGIGAWAIGGSGWGFEIQQ